MSKINNLAENDDEPPDGSSHPFARAVPLCNEPISNDEICYGEVLVPDVSPNLICSTEYEENTIDIAAVDFEVSSYDIHHEEDQENTSNSNRLGSEIPLNITRPIENQENTLLLFSLNSEELKMISWMPNDPNPMLWMCPVVDQELLEEIIGNHKFSHEALWNCNISKKRLVKLYNNNKKEYYVKYNGIILDRDGIIGLFTQRKNVKYDMSTINKYLKDQTDRNQINWLFCQIQQACLAFGDLKDQYAVPNTFQHVVFDENGNLKVPLMAFGDYRLSYYKEFDRQAALQNLGVIIDQLFTCVLISTSNNYRVQQTLQKYFKKIIGRSKTHRPADIPEIEKMLSSWEEDYEFPLQTLHYQRYKSYLAH